MAPALGRWLRGGGGRRLVAQSWPVQGWRPADAASCGPHEGVALHKYDASSVPAPPEEVYADMAARMLSAIRSRFGKT